VRNQLLYGDLMGWELYKQVFAANLRSGPLTFLDLQQMFTTQYRSFLGVFGWMNLPVPTWYYRAAGILVIAGLAGLAVYLARGKWHGLSRVQQATLLGMACTVIAQEVYILATVTQCNASCYQGRYMFPVIAPLMLLLAFGLLSLVPRPQARVLAGVLTLALAAAAVYMPLRVIAPAYAGVPEAKTSLWLMPHKMNVMFGDQIRLRGYDARIEGNGATVRLTLYWEAARKPDFNYSAFAHLLDASGQVIDQQDHAPGEDRGYPPGAWLPEDIVADTHTLSLPAGSDANGYQFRVGLYNWSTGQQLAVTSPQPAASFVILRL
jgi:hypothetical protein